MKKIFILISTLSSIALALTIGYVMHSKNIETPKPSDGRKKFRIAILLPCSHPSLEQIQKGFEDTLNKSLVSQFDFKTYNANGNRILQASQAQDILNNNFDLIFPISTTPAQVIKELCRKQTINTPVVYGAVSYPVKSGLIKSMESSGNNLTGVTDLLPHKQQIEALLEQKPSIKTLLLVYDAGQAGNQDECVPDIEKILAAKNIKLLKVEIFQSNEVFNKTSPFIDQADAVLIIKDSIVVSALDGLVKLCNRQHIPLMASDLDSPDRGAALGFGVSEYDMGVSSAQKALLILEQGKTPSQIPSSFASNCRLKINKTAALAQGLK